ncbi:MAG: hypothetical protein AB8F95_13000 [Bacteroidia bacterium]
MRSKNQEPKNFFWLSYADLMTSLFVITLALFILSYSLFKKREAIIDAKKTQNQALLNELDQKKRALSMTQDRLDNEQLTAVSLMAELNEEKARLLVIEEEYRKLKEIQKAIEALDPRYFVYQPNYKRHVLRKEVQFGAGKSVIKESDRPDLIQAGRELMRLVTTLNQDSIGANVKYLLVIEGQASKDNYALNYELSYERALALSRLWEKSGIRFDPNRVEVMISGSGDEGLGRDLTDEKKNQRFLIQIIPKIGQLDGVK